jgi:hypothetical protein
VKNEERDGQEDEDEDEDEEEVASKRHRETNAKLRDDKKLLRSASDFREWKWVMLMEGWKIFCEWGRRSNYCQPDFFGMYIYNDFYGYGIQELLENLVSCHTSSWVHSTDHF